MNSGPASPGMKERIREKQITDLALSAFLSSIGHPLRGIESKGQKAIFVFESTPQLEQDSLRYFNRNGQVDALTFSETLRNLKAAVKNHL